MFMGQYSHNLDSKGRLTIPSRYRALLMDGAYITQGFDRNLMVWTKAAFERISQRVSQSSITDPISRQLRRHIFSRGESLEVDRVGRILIPGYLREAAQLDNEVIVVGVGDYFEIWSPSLWGEQLTNMEDAETNQQRFSAFDLSAG